MKNVLVVAVHPDDETLGCGGTLFKHLAEGDQINWLIVTTIENVEAFEQRDLGQYHETIDDVAKHYRFNQVLRLNFPTTQLDRVPDSDLVGAFHRVFDSLKPQIIYLPFSGDIHGDHRIASGAALSATKTFRHPCIERILMMETLSETEFAPPLTDRAFQPNVFVNISDYMNPKLEVMNFYLTELGEHPFPRSSDNIMALATLRGATAGFNYAEAFMLVKERLP